MGLLKIQLKKRGNQTMYQKLIINWDPGGSADWDPGGSADWDPGRSAKNYLSLMGIPIL